MTLTQAALQGQSLLTKALLVVAGSLFIGAAAQVQVPMWPVPVTMQCAAEIIQLPMYPELTFEQVDEVCEVVKSALS